ncbi:Eco57I restriction-modification methylase domain-containing protein [Priestia megaterium]|uniref:Eco57I restriction-modification methylase domain-containing protein n=1 Tax=Priestia megaterium TaxID=1404 RepID=UPI00287810FD|nr:N-6 DNA methylase [Priestia megaterium]
MYVLDKSLRNNLERVVKEARVISEDAAKSIVNQIGVGESSPFSFLTEEERQLRRRLRAHGRQLGDKRDITTESQETSHLIEEIAYQHWHRMLFAKFLSENSLLMYPDPDQPVPVSLEECEDLAADEDAKNGWELASRFAAQMLPQIFRPESPVYKVTLPPEHQHKLELLISGLPKEVFYASDSLGWVYQFWQSKRKEDINDAEIKIGPDELPAVTQLFTEPYMVNFLLDNSLGAWWAMQRLSEEDLKNAKSEEELRKKASVPGVSLDYLRFIKNDKERWVPASEEFKHWSKNLNELKILDPCCGSGHFLIGALLMLVPMWIESRGLTAAEAIDAVISNNLYGLDIDNRVVEIAAFTLAFTAWRYPDSGGYRGLPEMNLACSGLTINAKKSEWLELAGDDTRLRNTLDLLYDLYAEAPTLGSLINPKGILDRGNILETSWQEVRPLIEKNKEKKDSDDKVELGVVAQGITKFASIISGQFSIVITNVPYLKSGYQGAGLKKYCERYYPDSKYDLATVFIERAKDLLTKGGALAVVTQQYWLFLKYYESMRKKFINNYQLGLIARLGPGAFETISGEVVNICLQITFNELPTEDYHHVGFELEHIKGIENKKNHLKNGQLKSILQVKQLENPDNRISFELSNNKNSELLSKYADFGKGSVSGDSPHYLRKFWEFDSLCSGRRKWLNSPTEGELWSGREHVILWGIDNYNPEEEIGFAFRGQRVFGKFGVAIGKAGKLRITPYTGELFDDNLAIICPYNQENLQGIWQYCNSEEFEKDLRKLDKKMSITAGTFTKVPFQTEKWLTDKTNFELFTPVSTDPTQWVFHGHPANSKYPVHVALARMLGYHWPVETDSKLELSEEARAWVEKCRDIESHSDKDGIICIPSVLGERSAADRLLDLLATAYGNEWNYDKLSELLSGLDYSGKTLESWLRNKFFNQHCAIFHHRPFIWHIWDGLNDGFAALLNYHKLDRKRMETLIYTYLGDWISRQKNDIASGIDGAQERLVAAENLKKRLELILKGEDPYDIFVRWKAIEKQPIGWEPDLNDGVRLNIRPFMTVEDVGKKGAGILRDKPNISWGKDRGKNSELTPWYDLFEGNRINDYHLTLAEKYSAREKLEKDEK